VVGCEALGGFQEALDYDCDCDQDQQEPVAFG